MRLFALFMVLFLGACGVGDPNKNPNDWDRQIWTDPETGCEYIFWQTGNKGSNNYAMTLTPRIGSDRLPVCKK